MQRRSSLNALQVFAEWKNDSIGMRVEIEKLCGVGSSEHPYFSRKNGVRIALYLRAFRGYIERDC